MLCAVAPHAMLHATRGCMLWTCGMHGSRSRMVTEHCEPTSVPCRGGHNVPTGRRGQYSDGYIARFVWTATALAPEGCALVSARRKTVRPLAWCVSGGTPCEHSASTACCGL
jgi:hypothetical protein